jgi:hypothetical protein
MSFTPGATRNYCACFTSILLERIAFPLGKSYHRLRTSPEEHRMNSHAVASGRRRPPPDLHATILAADLAVLRAAFGKDNRIAQLIGVDPAQISRWGRGQSPSPEKRILLRVFADTVRTLSETFEPSVIPGWFVAPRAGERLSPAEMLREGRYDELRETVEASTQGAFS